GVSEAEVKAESERAQLQLPLKGPKQRPARQSLPAELPRFEQLIACSAQECVCGACGREKVLIGYETAEQLDVEPAKSFVRVTKREKRACPHCPEQGVACAPLPPRIIEKSLASDRLIIETIVNKYADYVPLYAAAGIKRHMPGGRLFRSNEAAPLNRLCYARHSLKDVAASQSAEEV